jgi:uncharacterized DUF497 family protein
MQLTFDPVKNDRNIKDRGITFMLMSEMDWANAYIVEDQRNDYGERRFRVLGRINGGCMPLYLRLALTRFT